MLAKKRDFSNYELVKSCLSYLTSPPKWLVRSLEPGAHFSSLGTTGQLF